MTKAEETTRQEELLHAALELFAEHGFDGTSVRMIAEKAGMNVAMISYYFGSKEKMLHELIDRKTSMSRNQIDYLSANTEMNEWEKIQSLIDTYVERITVSGGQFHRLMMRELSIGARTEITDLIQQRISANREALRGIIESGIRKKIFRKDVDFGMMMCTMIGTITQSIMSQGLISLFDKGDGKKQPTEEDRRERVRTHLKEVFSLYLLVNPKDHK